jgi:hypothetical protein
LFSSRDATSVEIRGALLVALDRSSHRRVGTEELRWLLDADFFWDRAKRGSEALHGFLGFEDVEDTEPVRPISSGADEQTLERQVGR